MGLSGMASVRDLGSVIKCLGLQAQSGLAAGTGDNTEVTSPTIDRQEAGAAGFMSAVVAIAYKTSLTAAATLKLTLKIQESADNSTWDTAVNLQTALTLKTGALTNEVGVHEEALDLSSRKRYVRFLITMDLSAGATDVFVYGGTIVLGGADRLPV